MICDLMITISDKQNVKSDEVIRKNQKKHGFVVVS